MTITAADLMANARECVANNPHITDRELQAELESYYLKATNSFADLPMIGAINNPMDWLVGGRLLLQGLAKMIANKRLDGKSLSDIIAGIITIVSPNKRKAQG